jgi:hypothetical protein
MNNTALYHKSKHKIKKDLGSKKPRWDEHGGSGSQAEQDLWNMT